MKYIYIPIYIYIHTYIYILCTFNGNVDFFYLSSGEGRGLFGARGYPYSLFRTRSQLELQSELTKHNMIVIGIQWDIAGYIDQHTIGR